MTPVYKLSANSVKNGRTVYGSMLAGNTAYTDASFESIATATGGAGTSGTITFSSIPSTYSHLQVRAFMPVTSNNNAPYIRFNSDSGSNYTVHTLIGVNNGSVNAQGATSQSYINIAGFWFGIQTTYPGVSVVDILDYSNTNKYKTVRAIAGQDNNSTLGSTGISSGVWLNTNAITSISIILSGATTFASNAKFGLYGIKA